jgi:hypothetical protein
MRHGDTMPALKMAKDSELAGIKRAMPRSTTMKANHDARRRDHEEDG